MADTQSRGEQAADKAEAKAADRTAAAKATPAKAQNDAGTTPSQGPVGDASVPASATRVQGDITVTDAASAPFSTKPGDVPVDPRSGQPFETRREGLKGRHGDDIVNATGPIVPGVNPEAIPAEVTPGVSPDPGGDKLLAAAQAKAPSLTKEFVDAMGISDEQLAQIARGEIPPPPTPGPIYTNDLYMTPGGWQVTPPGVPPEDVGKNAIAR